MSIPRAALLVAVAVVAALAAAGCGTHPSPARTDAPVANHGGTAAAAGNPITRPDEAILSFRAAWATTVVLHVPLKEVEMTAAIDREMTSSPGAYTAKLSSCREARDLVARTNRESKFDFVLQGSLAALAREGECWEVEYHGDMKHEVIGYLDPWSGALLLVWRVPEG